jgi:hypothetical protein
VNVAQASYVGHDALNDDDDESEVADIAYKFPKDL